MLISIRGPLDPDVFTRVFVGDDDYYADDPKRRLKVHALLGDISHSKSATGDEKQRRTDIYQPIVLAYKELMPHLYSRSMSPMLDEDCGSGQQCPDVVTSARGPPDDPSEPILFSETDLLTEVRLDYDELFDDPLSDAQVQHDPFTHGFDAQYTKRLRESASSKSNEKLPAQSSQEVSDANVKQNNHDPEERHDFEEQDDDVTIGDDSMDADDTVMDEVSCLRAESDSEEEMWTQILDCALRIYRSRPRSCLFFVWLNYRHARLMRFDSSGVVVTHAFLYVPATDTGSSPLARFLYNFAHTAPHNRGTDPTIQRLYHSNPDHLADIERVHAKLADYNPLRPREARNPKLAPHVEPVPAGDLFKDAKNAPPMYRIVVFDEKGNNPRDYLAWCPFKLPHSLQGRMTSAYPAIARFPPTDGSDDNPVFLKNCFRDRSVFSLQEEVEILKVLEEKGVGRVPRYQYGGYVPVYDGARPTSRNQELFAGLSTFEQYRFVCTPLCRPLETADSVLQFAQAILDAFIAHMEAWEHPTNDPTKQVLHRDISDTNIQIGPDGRGYLVDWDLALLRQVLMDCEGSAGTWYFMAASLLKRPIDATHGIQEDMESFFWVTVYLLLKFFRVKNVPRVNLPGIEEECFDEAKFRFIKGRWRWVGGFEKWYEINTWDGWLATFQVSKFPAFGQWVRDIQSRLHSWCQSKREPPQPKQNGQDKELEDPSGLTTHREMKKLLEELVQSLKESGASSAKFPPVPDQFVEQHNSMLEMERDIAALQQKLLIQQEAQQRGSRAGSSHTSKTMVNRSQHSVSIPSSKRFSSRKRGSDALGEIEHSSPKRRRTGHSSTVKDKTDL
ncbi:hypothetical protein FISHEDRAFT_72837 [Fistulina hepatica ATCC 64428]|nr:hypothetical protein FISHEDRAFT_72837 [Fistulina hepatica ATCC 64428]